MNVFRLLGKSPGSQVAISYNLDAVCTLVMHSQHSSSMERVPDDAIPHKITGTIPLLKPFRMSTLPAKSDTVPSRTPALGRARRRLLLLVGILAGLTTLWVSFRLYLGSKHVALLVTSRLEAAYGGPVQIGEVDIGLGSSTLRDLQLFEMESDSSDTPWLVIERAAADVSILQLLGSSMPEQINLEGALVLLRFDEKGHLATRLPRPTGKPLPSFHINQGRFTLRQVGHPDLEVHGVQAELHFGPDEVLVTGTAADPYWGNWILRGELERKTQVTTLTLKAPTTHVTQTMLGSLPFVGPNVWKQVQCEGDTPVELLVRVDAANHKVHYRIDLEPVHTKVHVSSIDLHATEAQGKLVVEDHVLTLTRVRGRSADGIIKTDSVMNFHEKPTQLRFAVEVEKLDLRQLPRKWDVPFFAKGRLSGKADLQVDIIDGKSHTTGSGQGQITGYAGKRFAVPIPLALHADGKRFHFKVLKPAPGGTRMPGGKASQGP